MSDTDASVRTDQRTDDRTDARPATVARDHKILSALLGVVALVVLLQGLWAGLFLGHGGDGPTADGWMDVHARGADLAILLALVATVWGVIKLRAHRALWIGSAVLTVVLVLEAYLGGLIRDESKDSLTAIHVPIAMAIMALVVWLPLRARSLRR